MVSSVRVLNIFLFIFRYSCLQYTFIAVRWWHRISVVRITVNSTILARHVPSILWLDWGISTANIGFTFTDCAFIWLPVFFWSPVHPESNEAFEGQFSVWERTKHILGKRVLLLVFVNHIDTSVEKAHLLSPRNLSNILECQFLWLKSKCWL